MKRPGIWGGIILVIVLLSSLMNAGQQRQGKATVHIVVVDGFGRDLGKAEVDSFKGKYDEQDFSEYFRENTAKDIPYGEYQVRVVKTGFFTGQVTAQVFQPDVRVIVGLRYGEELPIFPAPRLQLTGTVRNIDPGEQPVYLKLAAVYSNFMMDTRVLVRDQSGTFTLAGVIPDGEYILLTIGRTRVLDVRQLKVEFPAKEPIIIELRPATGKKSG